MTGYGFLPNFSTPNNRGKVFNNRVRNDMRQVMQLEHTRPKTCKKIQRVRQKQEQSPTGMIIKQWLPRKMSVVEGPVDRKLKVGTSGDNINLLWVQEDKAE